MPPSHAARSSSTRLVPLVAIAAVLLLVVPTAPTAQAVTSVVYAQGTALHTYEDGQGSCQGEASLHLAFGSATGRVVLAGDSPCVSPYWGVLSNCQGAAGEIVRCHTQTDAVLIDLELAPDGTFSLLWEEDGFNEHIQGQLARQDVL